MTPDLESGVPGRKVSLPRERPDNGLDQGVDQPRVIYIKQESGCLKCTLIFLILGIITVGGYFTWKNYEQTKAPADRAGGVLGSKLQASKDYADDEDNSGMTVDKVTTYAGYGLAAVSGCLILYKAWDMFQAGEMGEFAVYCLYSTPLIGALLYNWFGAVPENEEYKYVINLRQKKREGWFQSTLKAGYEAKLTKIGIDFQGDEWGNGTGTIKTKRTTYSIDGIREKLVRRNLKYTVKVGNRVQFSGKMEKGFGFWFPDFKILPPEAEETETAEKTEVKNVLELKKTWRFGRWSHVRIMLDQKEIGAIHRRPQWWGYCNYKIRLDAKPSDILSAKLALACMMLRQEDAQSDINSSRRSRYTRTKK